MLQIRASLPHSLSSLLLVYLHSRLVSSAVPLVFFFYPFVYFTSNNIKEISETIFSNKFIPKMGQEEGLLFERFSSLGSVPDRMCLSKDPPQYLRQLQLYEYRCLCRQNFHPQYISWHYPTHLQY